MPRAKLIVLPDGIKAQFRLKPKNDEAEEGQLSDDDDDDNNNNNSNNDNDKNGTLNYSNTINGVKEPPSDRISLTEIQSFLIALILPEPRLSTPPKWCRVLKCMRASNVGIYLVDNSDLDWLDDPGSKFTHAFRFDTNPDWIYRLINVPMSRRQQQIVHQEIQPEEFETNLNGPHKASKLDLLLSPVQMIREKFPLPTEIDILASMKKFERVSDDSPIFALDCEMCMTVGNVSELTRISIVDDEMKVVYNELVKPSKPIIDYLTRYSGITPAMMKDVKTTIEDVHKFIRNNLPRNSIFCGHSLNNDLKALKLFHPYVIDTSVLYNKSGQRAYKPSLKLLAYEYLDKQIQKRSSIGHDSLEDALTTMELLKLKLVNGPLFGDILANNCAQGVTHDPKTGIPYLTIDKFIERQKVVNVAFRYLDTTPGARCLYIHDQRGPLLQEVKDSIQKLLDAEKSVCVILTGDGVCYIKI